VCGHNFSEVAHTTQKIKQVWRREWRYRHISADRWHLSSYGLGIHFLFRRVGVDFTRNFRDSFFFFKCFGTFCWLESIMLTLKSHNFSTLDSTSLLKTGRPLDRQFFMLQAKQDKCFFLWTCRLLNPCLHSSSTCLVTKILSGLLLSVTLSLFTLTVLLLVARTSHCSCPLFVAYTRLTTRTVWLAGWLSVELQD